MVLAFGGAYLLVAAPLAGLLVALAVFGALRRVCRTGSRSARDGAWAGIMALLIGAYFGISFGGFMLLVPAALLAVAAAITPRPPALPARTRASIACPLHRRAPAPLERPFMPCNERVAKLGVLTERRPRA